MLNLKIKKLNDLAKLPTQATIGSAGLDLYATSEKLVVEGPITYVEYSTGIAVQIPPGHMGLIIPRSSISSNTTLMLANSCGLIDSDYRGEITARFKNLSIGASRRYKTWDRIAQLIILPYPAIEIQEVDDLESTERGSGGHGSSGI
jgi:dUTP pyrophosphatase